MVTIIDLESESLQIILSYLFLKSFTVQLWNGLFHYQPSLHLFYSGQCSARIVTMELIDQK